MPNASATIDFKGNTQNIDEVFANLNKRMDELKAKAASIQFGMAQSGGQTTGQVSSNLFGASSVNSSSAQAATASGSGSGFGGMAPPASGNPPSSMPPLFAGSNTSAGATAGAGGSGSGNPPPPPVLSGNPPSGGGYGNTFNYYHFNPQQANVYQNPNNPNPSPSPSPGGGGGYGGLRGYRSTMGYEAAYAAANTVGSYFSYEADRARNGGDDPMGRAGIVASGISGAIGVGVGLATGNPLFGMAAGHISQTVLGPLSQYLAAPVADRQDAAVSLQGVLAGTGGPRTAKWGTDYFTGVDQDRPWYVAEGLPRGQGMTRVGRMSALINDGLPDYLQVDRYGKAVGASMSAVASGLFAGGRDPWAMSETYRTTYRPNWASEQQAARREEDSGGMMLANRSERGNLTGLAAVTKGFIHEANKLQKADYSESETLAETYTRRIGQLFRGQIAEGTKQLAPIFATEPETGGNATDILRTYGAERTANYLRIQQDDLRKDDVMLGPNLMKLSAGLRSNERQIRLDALQARGVGASMERDYTSAIQTLDASDLPGARDSETYRQLQAAKRGATLQRYDEQDALQFDIPQLELSGRMARRKVSPYSPGSMMKDAAEDAALKARELRVKGDRYSSLVATGGVSERQQVALFGELESLKTGIAEDIGTLNTDIENRIAGSVVGAPSMRGHANSVSLAAYANLRRGAPNRSAGAYGGTQVGMQQAWQAAFSTGDFNAPAALAPHSRTADANNVSALLPYLDRIARAVEGNSGSKGHPGQGPRPAESRGNAIASTDPFGYDPRGNYKR